MAAESPRSYFSHLECPVCGQSYSGREPTNFCACGRPLLARYDLAAIRRYVRRSDWAQRPHDLWRYRELLPVLEEANVVTLGEGGAPLLPLRRLGAQLGLRHLFLKEEGYNPTGTFKARGLAMAVSKAKELGLRKLAISTAGNAGSAMAAYAAAAGLEAYIFAPDDTPPMIVQECLILGARTYVIKGLINDAGRIVQEGKAEHGWFDMSTLKEPYRLEGKKTMGIELAEDFGWHLPDVILYPTGGGTGLIGMWKAFAELRALGWIDDHRPRMVVVQATGCAPIVKAFEEGATESTLWPNAHTMASGLRVPKAFADFLILQAVRDSEGTAIAVSDEEMARAQRLLATNEGIFACPEGAATLAALQVLRQREWVQAHERVVLFNTGSGLKYADLLQATPSYWNGAGH
ncbi:MAG TPA: threonine synthase [Candidatus Tectomicrobia bacterium]|nr:threonine synthase [Candidatus Tectomicrobia bacterium]